jgi:hypothetical protein
MAPENNGFDQALDDLRCNGSVANGAPSKLSSGTRKRDSVRVRVVAGAFDPAALTSAINEWLVPLLVQKFITERKTSYLNPVIPDESTTNCTVTEGAADGCVRT